MDAGSLATKGLNIIMTWKTGSDLDIQVKCGCDKWHGYGLEESKEGESKENESKEEESKQEESKEEESKQEESKEGDSEG